MNTFFLVFCSALFFPEHISRFTFFPYIFPRDMFPVIFIPVMFLFWRFLQSRSRPPAAHNVCPAPGAGDTGAQPAAVRRHRCRGPAAGRWLVSPPPPKACQSRSRPAIPREASRPVADGVAWCLAHLAATHLGEEAESCLNC